MKKFITKPFHPFLWAIFPTLALLGANISQTPPVNSLRALLVSLVLAVIIQGDHGVPRLSEVDTTILNAYYLPGNGSSALYSTISPVNSFRVVFDQYFSGDLPLLADRSCNMDKAQGPFSCIPVRDPNPQCVALSKTPAP